MNTIIWATILLAGIMADKHVTLARVLVRNLYMLVRHELGPNPCIGYSSKHVFTACLHYNHAVNVHKISR